MSQVIVKGGYSLSSRRTMKGPPNLLLRNSQLKSQKSVKIHLFKRRDILILSRSNFLDYYPETIFPIIQD